MDFCKCRCRCNLQSILGREFNEHLRMGEHQALPEYNHVNQEIIIV